MIELIDRPGTVMCPLCMKDKPDVKLIKLSSDYLYGTFALCKDCREELIKALGSCRVYGFSPYVGMSDQYPDARV